MRPTKVALSALALALALGGTAYAADTATPAQPAANSAVHAAAPAKHRIFKKRAAKKAPAHAASSTSTSTSTLNTTTGAH